jgi:hypothetical protein
LVRAFPELPPRLKARWSFDLYADFLPDAGGQVYAATMRTTQSDGSGCVYQLALGSTACGVLTQQLGPDGGVLASVGHNGAGGPVTAAGKWNHVEVEVNLATNPTMTVTIDQNVCVDFAPPASCAGSATFTIVQGIYCSSASEHFDNVVFSAD